MNLSGKRKDRAAAAVIAVMVALFSGGLAHAQQKPPLDPDDLVRRAAANEIKANESHVYFMFKDRNEDKGHSNTKEVVQTPQGGLTRTIAINDQPLTPEQRAKDDQKLQKFANDPEARRKRKESTKEDDERDALMLSSLPDAFLYTYAGEEPGPSGPVVHLTFKPNPKFNPPNHETMVYLGMQGDMLIDAKAVRIAKIDGTLFKDVDFGWGILGRLYKGGKFLIEQKDVGSGHWETVVDRYWASKTKVDPVPLSGGLILEGSNKSLEDLIAETERALLVTRFWYLRPVNPVNVTVTGLTRDGSGWSRRGRSSIR